MKTLIENRDEKVKHVKAALKRRGVKYDDVARLAGVGWWMVWAVLKGDKTSANVIDALVKLCPEAKVLRA